MREGDPDPVSCPVPEEPAAAPAPGAGDDSAAFARCADCMHSEELSRSAGTLLCKKHNMRINAEADEIPDDCAENASQETDG